MDVYPFELTSGPRTKFLLWVNRHDEPDSFFCSTGGRLLLCASFDDLRHEASKIERVAVHFDEGGRLDIATFWKKLKNLRAGRSASIETCVVLLDGWNLIEDLARSIDVLGNSFDRSKKKTQMIYEKIVYGCNLPSITPDGRNYTPVLSATDITMLRSEVGRLWSAIIGRVPQLKEFSATES